MANALDILIRIKQSGQNAFSKTEQGLKRMNLAAKAYRSTLNSLNNTTNSFVGNLTRMVAVLGGADLFRRFVTSGLGPSVSQGR